MFAFGIIGFLAGLLFRGKREKYKKSKLILCLYGGIATLVIYGFLMDTSSITMFGTGFSWKALAAMYASGLPFNIVHGISTMVFLFFLAGPMDRDVYKRQLNGWFTDKGFASFTVADGTFADGDVITLEYTTNYGSDLTDTTDVTGELKSLGNNTGDLSPEYKRNVYKYTLTVPKDTTEVSFRPESFNRYNNVAIRVGDKSYRYGDAIPVSEGTEIKITSTPTSFMSLLGLKDGVTYTITVKSLEEPEKTCLLYTSEMWKLHRPEVVKEMEIRAITIGLRWIRQIIISVQSCM